MFGLEIRYTAWFPRIIRELFNNIWAWYIISNFMLLGLPFFLNVYFSYFFVKPLKEASMNIYKVWAISTIFLVVSHFVYVLISI